MFHNVFLFIELVGYSLPYSKEWCADNEEIDGRNGCATDKECLNIARKKCDVDPDCTGIAWYENRLEQPLRICKSNEMARKTDGWRTMMKQGIEIVSLYKKNLFRLYLYSNNLMQ